MKAPDLSSYDDAGVRDWKGALEPLKSAATHAKLGFAAVDLGRALIGGQDGSTGWWAYNLGRISKLRAGAAVVPGVDHRFHRAEQGGCVAGGQCLDRVVDERDIGGPEQRQRPLVGDVIPLGPGQQLIEHREGVAGRTAAGAHHQRVDGVVHLDVLGSADVPQLVVVVFVDVRLDAGQPQRPGGLDAVMPGRKLELAGR